MAIGSGGESESGLRVPGMRAPSSTSPRLSQWYSGDAMPVVNTAMITMMVKMDAIVFDGALSGG